MVIDKHLRFELALSKDVNDIYKIYKRIFGLIKSINDKCVWVFRYKNEVVGFVRYNKNEGMRVDYLKFYEIAINEDYYNNIKIVNMFFNNIDNLILGLGYYKSKVYISSNIEMYKLLIRNNWVELEHKFSISNKKVFTNFIFSKDLSNNINKHINKFGKLLLE